MLPHSFPPAEMRGVLLYLPLVFGSHVKSYDISPIIDSQQRFASGPV